MFSYMVSDSNGLGWSTTVMVIGSVNELAQSTTMFTGIISDGYGLAQSTAMFTYMVSDGN